MAKNAQPVAKRCKALGIAPSAMGYDKKITNRNPKGQMRRKQSEYAIQLNEKQKVKFVYGMLEKQFRSYYERAEKMPGKSGDNLLILCERRLDNVVYHLGFAQTRRQARQLVNHGHFTVDGHKVNIPSYMVKAGDVIEVREKSKKLACVLAAIESQTRDWPEYLEVDAKKLTAKYTFVPKFQDIPYAAVMEPNLVIEYYSR